MNIAKKITSNNPMDGMKMPQRRTLSILFIGFVLAGLTFFFTSNLWLGSTYSLQHTPLGGTATVGSSEITLKGWEYNQAENYMLIDLGTRSNNYTKEVSYSINIVDENNSVIEAGYAYYSNSCIMIRIDRIPNCKYIQLQISERTFQYAADNTTVLDSTVNYSNPIIIVGEMTRIPEDDFISGNLSQEELVVLDWSYDVDLLQLREAEILSQIETQNQIISTAENKISTLNEELALMTTNERQTANGQIANYQSAIASAQRTILTLQESLETVRSAITEKQDIIQEYKREHGMA